MDLESPRPLNPLEERISRFLYGLTGGTLVVRREVHAEPRQVLDAVGRTVLHSPYDLRLHDNKGGHPLEGGTLTFRFLRLEVAGSYMESLKFRMKLAQLYLYTLDLMLEIVPDGTAVVIYGDLDREVSMGVRRYLVPMVVIWSLMAVVGAWVTSEWLATDPERLSHILGTGALVGALVGVVWYRWFCRRVVRGVERALEGMLGAVEEDVSAQGSPPDQPLPG